MQAGSSSQFSDGKTMDRSSSPEKKTPKEGIETKMRTNEDGQISTERMTPEEDFVRCIHEKHPQLTIRQVTGKGRTVVAARKYAAGEFIFCERPATSSTASEVSVNLFVKIANQQQFDFFSGRCCIEVSSCTRPV